MWDIAKTGAEQVGTKEKLKTSKNIVGVGEITRCKAI